ncbi:MAG TPA: hypothetical protein VM145_02950 [Sphingomicrobium sp.]|nr:hypothetical protein [Sphingomicrobium sp.]
MTAGDALQAVLRDPQWLPHAFCADGSKLSFVRVTRDMHRTLPFVDERQLRDSSEWALIGIDSLLEQLPAIKSGPAHFVFHTAFCCSTLLVNGLAATGSVAGIKEPAIFADLMQRLERGQDLRRTRQLELVIRLLARPFEGTKATILKPTCFASPLMPYLLATMPGARAVLLHSGVRTFLYSVAKRGLAGRKWGRQVYASSIKHAPLDLGFSPAQTWEQTDLQIAGLGWLMRRNYFNQSAARHGPRRVLQVDGDELARSPIEPLQTVAGHLGLPVAERAWAAAGAGPLFHQHSKEGRPFGPRERDSESRKLRDRHQEEVEAVAQWVERIAEHRGIELLEHAGDMRLAS